MLYEVEPNRVYTEKTIDKIVTNVIAINIFDTSEDFEKTNLEQVNKIDKAPTLNLQKLQVFQEKFKMGMQSIEDDFHYEKYRQMDGLPIIVVNPKLMVSRAIEEKNICVTEADMLFYAFKSSGMLENFVLPNEVFLYIDKSSDKEKEDELYGFVNGNFFKYDETLYNRQKEQIANIFEKSAVKNH